MAPENGDILRHDTRLNRWNRNPFFAYLARIGLQDVDDAGAQHGVERLAVVTGGQLFVEAADATEE